MPVVPGQHPVEHHQIGQLFSQMLLCLCAGTGMVHFVSRMMEIQADQLGDRKLIFDQQNPGHTQRPLMLPRT